MKTIVTLRMLLDARSLKGSRKYKQTNTNFIKPKK
jgi:hypothetical protein